MTLVRRSLACYTTRNYPCLEIASTYLVAEDSLIGESPLDLQVAVVGSTTLDRVVMEGGATYLKWGGVPVYAGLTFSRSGVATGVCTNVSARDHAVVDLLSNASLSVDTGYSQATTEFVNHVDGDHRLQELYARAAPISAPQLTAIAAKVGHVHLGPLHPRDIDPEALPALHNVGLVSIDIQGYVRRIEGTDILPGVSEHLTAALEQADIVKASRDELEEVKTFYGAELEAIMRNYGLEQWLITEGKEGGWLLDSSGRRHEFQAIPVEECVDPTGAGDVFFAAYLTQHVYQKKEIDVALKQAGTAAARQIEGKLITAEALTRRDN